MVPSNFSTSAVKFGCQDWTQAVVTAGPNTKVVCVSILGVEDKGFIKYARGFLRVIVLQTLFSPSSIGPTCGDNIIISRVVIACLHSFFHFFLVLVSFVKPIRIVKIVYFSQVIVVKDLISDQNNALFASAQIRSPFTAIFRVTTIHITPVVVRSGNRMWSV